MANMGRPRKPVADHFLNGTYRDDRHGGYVEFDGVPVKPAGLSDDGSQLWDAIVPHLVRSGVAKEPDVAELGAMCYWWGRFRELTERLTEAADARDKSEFRLHILTASAWKQCSAIMSKYGLTPADRAKIRNVAAQADESDPFAALAGARN